MKKILFIQCVIFLISISLNAAQTQYKTYETKEEFQKGSLDGLAVCYDGKISPLINFSQIDDKRNLSGEIWDSVRIEEKIYIASSNPAAITIYEKKSKEYVFDTSYVVSGEQVAAVSRLYYDFDKKKLIYSIVPEAAIYEYPDKLICRLDDNYVYDIIKYKEFYYASTGPNGRIYRIGISGQPELFYKIKDNDCLALGVYGDKILAGGSSSGNLYSIPVDDTVSAEIIEDFGEAEIKKIIVGNNKIFAAVNTIMGGNRFQQNEPVQEEIMDEETAIEFFGEITEEYIENSGQTQEEIISKIKNKNSNQTAIKKNNYKNGLIFEIEETRKTIAAELKNDFIVNFDIVKNGDIYAVSGKKNSALKINKKDYSIVFVNKSGKIQNINFDESGKPLLITVSNPSRILTADNSKKEFEYVSEIIDMENKSELGVPEIEHGGKIEYSYRTGNSSKINDLWSVWKTGRLNSAARYFQFKIRFLSADSFLKKITIPYIQLNLKPALKYANINPSFPKSRNSKSKQTISRQMQGVQINQPQNPVSEAMMIEAAQNFQEQQQMQPNMQLGTAEPTYNIRWSASDPNNDKLSHNIYYRYETGEWIKIKFDKHYTRNSYTWKTSYFPDGKYRFKIETSDMLDNPDNALTDEILTEEIILDNTPPEIKIEKFSDKIIVTADDKINLIKSCEYSVDGADWKRLNPEDNIFDSKTERFVLKKENINGTTIAFKITDFNDNTKIAGVISE